ncbi:MAG: ParB/RepB/Spo0J family partition protein [Oscillospiraceae bacterium]|nr:ParB/RepB/Spo0J family partition protein [Oscillospiraceae bacterium]
MAKKKALGGVLDNIFDDDLFGGGAGEGAGIVELKIGDIEPNRDQPRKDFDQAKLEELANSIRQHGIVQPLTVRSYGDAYQIVAGERRWRAARLAGEDSVPVRVMELTDAQTMQIALIENLQREDLNPIEEAMGFQELIDNYSMTQEQLANVVGRARSSVTNSLRLLNLPDEVIALVRNGKLSKGHCKAIMAAGTTKLMKELARRAAAGELTVRDTERLAAESKVTEKAEKENARKPRNTYYKETELALGQALGTKVRITDGGNGKKKTLCIDFADDEQLKGILDNFS